MATGSIGGIFAYYHPDLGWYTASLIGTTISMFVMGAATLLAPRPFTWSALGEGHTKTTSHASIS
jgi:hypothetical protein